MKFLGVELYLTPNFSFVVSIFSPTIVGEVYNPPSRAPMLGKAKLPLGGCLVSQRMLFKTDSPAAIHPIGTVFIP
jgi:hypothetical protein